MQFNKVIAVIAVMTFAGLAKAEDGTLRRDADDKPAAQQVQQSTGTTVEVVVPAQTAQPVQQQQPQAVTQPATVVQAAPVAPSHAEELRKQREQAEVGTEQKIVEKLEESRLQEEKARADRLFGDKFDAPKEQPAPQAAQPAPAPAPAPAVVQETKPAQVTIEKVEIVQPKAEPAPAPVAESKADLKPIEEQPSSNSYYVSGLLGNLSYAANNVKSNYGLGVAVGMISDNKVGFEVFYLYSNHNVDDVWGPPIYHTMEQMDLGGKVKYYFLTGKLKPYLGGSATYITRKYTDRNGAYNGYVYGEQTTHAVDAGVLGGVDLALNDSFTIGAGADYNFNVMTPDNFNNPYNNYYNSNQVNLEKISYWTLTVGAKLTF